MAQIQETDNSKCWQESVEQRELLFMACGNVKCCRHSEDSLAASY